MAQVGERGRPVFQEASGPRVSGMLHSMPFVLDLAFAVAFNKQTCHSCKGRSG